MTMRQVHTLVMAVCLGGCAVPMQRAAIRVEHTLDAGSAALTMAVDRRIAECRARDLPTPEARADCVKDVREANANAEPLVDLSVAGLRAFWIAAAAHDRPGMREQAAEVARHVSKLPPEYFRGVARAAWWLGTR